MGNIHSKIILKTSNNKIINQMTEQNKELVILDIEKINNFEKEIETNNKLKSNFKKYLYKSTPKFNEVLNKKFVVGRVVDIYDGDTITCVINIFDNYFLFNIRLGDIDTCEIKSKNIKCKTKAYEAQTYLYELISKKTNDNIFLERKNLRFLLESEIYLVNILCGTLDKYGRLLGWIFDLENLSQDKTKSFNHILIEKKLAYKYQGDTKLTEEEQIKLFN
jgi:endonuclease YncB( thermonuclease family)